MVSPSQKRRAIKHVIEQGKGTTAEVCRALDLQRSTYYRNSRVSPERQEMERTIINLSEEHPRYGYRRITVLARRDGELINAKRVLKELPLSEFPIQVAVCRTLLALRWSPVLNSMTHRSLSL